MVKWLRLARGLPGPEALETARRLGLAPEPRVNGSLQSSPNGHRPYRQPRSVENAPLAALPSRYGACYRYRSPDGTEYARVFRYPENHPGRKADPYTRRSGGKYAGTWTHRAPRHRWPYRIDTLTDSTPVVIVEGEKCADALAGLTREIGVLSWLGGSGAVLRTDWESLSGREVILWPDADDPGREAMARLAGELDRIGAAKVLVIDPEEDGPAVGTWPTPSRRTVGDGRKSSGTSCRPNRSTRRRTAGSGGPPSRFSYRPARLNPIGSSGSGSPTFLQGSDPDGRGARLRQELPEHRSGSRAVPGPDPVSRRRTGKVPTAILSLEDDPARTIVPRLKACGADLGGS